MITTIIIISTAQVRKHKKSVMAVAYTLIATD